MIAVSFVIGAGSASAAGETRLVISGAFHATTARAVPGTCEGCGYRSTRRRILRRAGLCESRGSAVALVEFLIPNYRGRGRRRYDASSPGTVRSNGGAGRHRAQSDDGRSRRLLYRNIRKRYRLASPQRWPTRAQRSVSGTVHAKLRLQLATRRLRLDGNWHCRILIPLEVNGG